MAQLCKREREEKGVGGGTTQTATVTATVTVTFVFGATRRMRNIPPCSKAAGAEREKWRGGGRAGVSKGKESLGKFLQML